MARPRKFDDERVIEAAMETFWTKGYVATSTEDLIETTGLGRGSLYNAFASKRQLFDKALRRYNERGAARQIAPLERDAPVAELIRDWMLQGVEMVVADPRRRGCLAVNTVVELAGEDPEAVAVARLSFISLENALTKVIERGQRDGDLRTDRPARTMATLLMSTLYGLLVLAKAAPDRKPLIDVIEATIAGLR